MANAFKRIAAAPNKESELDLDQAFKQITVSTRPKERQRASREGKISKIRNLDRNNRKSLSELIACQIGPKKQTVTPAKSPTVSPGVKQRSVSYSDTSKPNLAAMLSRPRSSLMFKPLQRLSHQLNEEDATFSSDESLSEQPVSQLANYMQRGTIAS